MNTQGAGQSIITAPSSALDGDRAAPAPRFDSRDLFQQAREIEIVHGDKVYTLRLTNLNKLILTA